MSTFGTIAIQIRIGVLGLGFLAGNLYYFRSGLAS